MFELFYKMSFIKYLIALVPNNKPADEYMFLLEAKGNGFLNYGTTNAIAKGTKYN